MRISVLALDGLFDTGLSVTLDAFGAAADTFGALVPAELAALRTRMFERHLAWPIEL